MRCSMAGSGGMQINEVSEKTTTKYSVLHFKIMDDIQAAFNNPRSATKIGSDDHFVKTWTWRSKV
ncbi:unnamed protein product, partial [Amoebophrya sp. A25]|eukprot:GSA25T00011739001.1